MRIYLDNCAYNRPFDDQSNARVRSESESIITILQYVRDHSVDLVWSSAVDYENDRSRISERREAVSQWRFYSTSEVSASEMVEEYAGELLELGFDKLDSIHIASAMVGFADYFVTTDDRILKRKGKINKISIVNPTELVKIIHQ